MIVLLNGSHDHHNATRIGEAGKPGPSVQQLINHFEANIQRNQPQGDNDHMPNHTSVSSDTTTTGDNRCTDDHTTANCDTRSPRDHDDNQHDNDYDDHTNDQLLRIRLVNARGGGRHKAEDLVSSKVHLYAVTELDLAECGVADFKDNLTRCDYTPTFAASCTITKNSEKMKGRRAALLIHNNLVTHMPQAFPGD